MKERIQTRTKRSLQIVAGIILLASMGFAGYFYIQSHEQIIEPDVPSQIVVDPSKVQGRATAEVGYRSPFEKPKKLISTTSARTPLQDLYGTITPADLHFERHHAGIPEIDPEQHELLIHGLLAKPIRLTLADLKRYPSVSRICFIECSGNFRYGKREMTPQEVCGLTSQSEWTGVLLSTILKDLGVKSSAKWFLAEGADGALMARSVPLEEALPEAIIAYGQNGEAIRPQQGYPMRLVIPGFEGNTQIKWLRRIELTDKPVMTREETSKYTEKIKDGKIRMFSLVMDARSIITYPAYPKTIEKGWQEIRGIAWSGRGKVKQVLVSTDNGVHWNEAHIQGPVLEKAHTAFRFMWNWDGKPTRILSKVIDETGYVQPTYNELVEARESKGGYHFNPIVGWDIDKNGSAYLAKVEDIN
ncbi:sulfite dehydrogenase [Sphingobacterium paludis]|uniref:Sulfane dehydrogenase subunit SoxC n=1 Tax=Sphingobacterium paludis TaxID=1476465 RepID=A0A4R7CYZ1_9SPHI|nr:sulfite dehydrogenase [Sphingobacterium paludis]TDS12971.1 sulfane dehydrogenase subunit SoxC [Sphingobacterium paludis]